MEKIWVPHHNLADFSESPYTAIVSDLHLCEEEPINERYPLWKKYKTKQFFFDDVFVDFLHFINRSAGDQVCELVFNGDTFDFDSVTKLPEHPSFQISNIEKSRGLFSQEEKSVFKMHQILADHPEFVKGVRDFLARGNRIVFVIGNHDLELIWPAVQEVVVKAFAPTPDEEGAIRFCEFFYISNRDTLIEHGHQYDPYCRAEDPIYPFVLRYNKLEIRIPFGNLASRYMINAMGFFNPYTESNYLMSIGEYVKYFVKYIARAQPFLVLTWLWGATLTLAHTLRDRLRSPLSNPLVIEDFIADVAKRANATPRMVRQLKELAVPTASSHPLQIARELWLDRAFIVLMFILAFVEGAILIKQFFDISVYWLLPPILMFVPFFIFYSRSIVSKVISYKEPQERILSIAGYVTGVHRVIYGHTHIVRHEVIGPIEHLNSGTWSAAFLDVECQKTIEQRTFIFVRPEHGRAERKAEVYQMTSEGPQLFFRNKKKKVAELPLKHTA